MEQITQPLVGKRTATPDRSLTYMGDRLAFLVWGKETDGRINLVQSEVKATNVPPPHYHAWENEIFYVLEGQIEAYCEGVSGSIMVGPNELVFFPRNHAHAMRFHTPTVRMLTIIQGTGEHPVTVDEYFVGMSQSADSSAAEAAPTTYDEIDMQKAMELAARHGAFFLSPEEVAKRLPNFPGL